jgi:hypothetical protein
MTGMTGMIGWSHSHWRSGVVVRQIAELCAEAARDRRAQRQTSTLPVTSERSPGAGPEPGQPSSVGA